MHLLSNITIILILSPSNDPNCLLLVLKKNKNLTMVLVEVSGRKTKQVEVEGRLLRLLFAPSRKLWPK